jgi:hypothetical protein
MNKPDKPIPETYWVLADRFLAGGYPGSHDDVQTRRRLAAFLTAGFDTFVDLTNPGERPDYLPLLRAEAKRLNRPASHQRFAFPDFSVPSLQSMTAVLDALDEALSQDHKIYLHCVGGIGRTGMAVGCYLVRHGRSGQEALDELARLYRSAGQSAFYAVSPENGRQVTFIRDWQG